MQVLGILVAKNQNVYIKECILILIVFILKRHVLYFQQ